MLTVKSSAHIRTNRHRPSFHGCRASTGAPMWRVEAAGRIRDEIGLLNREARRLWLAGAWTAHRNRNSGGRT